MSCVNSNVDRSSDEWPKIYYLKLLRVSEGTLSRWSRLHLQYFAPTNLYCTSVVGYGPFSSCVIHKEGLYGCTPAVEILSLMMIVMCRFGLLHT
jgi:hypothetical protein